MLVMDAVWVFVFVGVLMMCNEGAGDGDDSEDVAV